jgi:ATP-binding cassette subfamily F protein uup
VLAPEPDILLLDEPTNHLDLTTIEWLEGELRGRRTALVLISHDRRFLENLSRITVWLDRGKTRRLEVGFSQFEEQRDLILAEEERDQHKLDRKIASEEHWIRYGVTARRKRNVRRMGEIQKMREQRRTYRGSVGKATIEAAESDKSGTLVIEAKGISKSFGERPIVSDFSTRIHRGDRIGIVGPNGSGKTTLVGLLTGAIEPDSGTIKLGTNLDVATLDQRRESLDPEWTLREAMTGGSGDTITVAGKQKHVVSYMKDFLFTPEQIRTPLRALSGGERGRLMLARALARPSNLLVLDEPTNDLDLETLDVLEETLGDYTGTVILISHDRDFLDRAVNSVIAPDGNGKWTEYAGGYTDMIAQRGGDLARRKDERVSPKEERIAAPEAPKQKRKLSFNDKYALENLPKQMAKLEADMKALQVKLADPQLYAKDRKAFDDATAKFAAAQAELSASEEKWLALEMLREEIEGA